MRDESTFGDPARNRTAAPFMRALGTVWLGGDESGVKLRLPCVPATCGGAHRESIDLRAVAAVLDHAGGAVVYAALDGARATATLDLRIDFLAATVPGRDLFISAAGTDFDSGCALITGHAWCDDPTAPVARLCGRFIVGKGPGQGDDSADLPLQELAAASFHDEPAPQVASFGDLLGGRGHGTEWTLPYAPWRVGGITLPALHGGVVASGLMTAAQQAVPADSGLRLASINVQYTRAAKASETRFEAMLLKRGARALFVGAEATQEEGRRRVATLQCLYA